MGEEASLTEEEAEDHMARAIVGNMIGERVRRIRQQKGLTLRAVEQRARVSATHVSEIERGKTSPTVGVIGRIAAALGVGPAELFDLPPASTAFLQAPPQRRCFTRPGSLAQVEGLTFPHGPSELSGHLLTLDPGGGFSDAAHDGEELCFVLEGALEVRLDGVPHIVRQHEALHFRPRKTHEIRNPTRTVARAIWVSRPRAAL
jgi:transcriptional regulator with XRE-family HTH domain